MNGVQTRFKCKLDVKRCKRFVFPPSSLLPRSNALKTKAIRYFQTDRTLTRIVSPPLPVFWNTSWFKMRPPHTTGIFLNEYHPLFREFPTEYHSNLQWWELLNKAQVMQFTGFPADFQPTIQSIDTWFINRKIGMLFEANVLNGKVLMTSMDITSKPEKRVVARQMHKAILDYMNSDAFRPTANIAPELIQELFTKVAGDVKSYTKDSPDELKPNIN